MTSGPFLYVTSILEILRTFDVREFRINDRIFFFCCYEMIALISGSISLFWASKFCVRILPFFGTFIRSTHTLGFIGDQNCWWSLMWYFSINQIPFTWLFDWFHLSFICSIDLLRVYIFVCIPATSKDWFQFNLGLYGKISQMRRFKLLLTFI